MSESSNQQASQTDISSASGAGDLGDVSVETVGTEDAAADAAKAGADVDPIESGSYDAADQDTGQDTDGATVGSEDADSDAKQAGGERS